MRKQLHKLEFATTRSINHDVAYFLGMMWADGHVNDKECCLYLNENDFIDIWPVLSRLGFTKYNQVPKSNGQDQMSIRCGQQSLITWLIELGFKDKSHTPPSKLLENLDRDLQTYFIRGFFDGDGTVCIDSRRSFRVSISGPYDYEWIFLTDFCNRNSILNTSINRVDAKTGRGSNFVITRKSGQINFLETIYNNFELDSIGLTRKYRKFQDMKYNINNNILSIGKKEEKNICKCGTLKNISSIYCRSCNGSRSKRTIPNKEELLNILKTEKRITYLCKHFNISHTIFKKWLTFHGLSLS